jgi:DNA-binding LacI/PurR family transcriptional regulator
MTARRKKAPTMEDVARLAGVHRVTASVALSGAHASTRVSEETRERVLAAAKELGYHPNARALALRRSSTDIIGLYSGYTPNAHDPFTAEVINGLHQVCTPHEKDLLMFGDFEGRSADEVYASLANGKIDGLVMIPAPNRPLINNLAGSHLPVVAIADGLPDFTSVVVDDAGGSRLAVEHLAGRGHQRVLYRTDMYEHTSALRRLEAFQQAAAAAGMEVIATRPGDWDGNLSPEEEALLLVPPGEHPTAAACWADQSAYALLDACERLGIRVPEELAVVGFDGISTRIRPARQLTTIRAPWREVAVRAVELLLALLGGQEVPQETVFPVELVIGDTT